MKFFNPGALLPSPEVAVNPVPQRSNFLLTESLKEITGLVKKKQDVDSVRKEAEILADYVQSDSPQLSEMLRQKAASYNLATDTNAERSGLLKGVLELRRQEIAEKKADVAAGLTRMDNLFGVKLNAAQSDLENTRRLKIEFDQEQRMAKAAHDKQRLEAQRLGQTTPPFQPQANPFDAQLTEKQTMFDQLLQNTPNSVPKSYASGSKPLLPAGESPVPPNSGSPLFPNDQTDLPMSDLTGVDTSLLSAPPEAPVSNEPPQLTETSKKSPFVFNKPMSPISERPLIPAYAPVNEADPINAQALAVRKAMDNKVKVIQKNIKASVDSLKSNSKYAANPEDVSRIEALAKDAELEIAAIPNPGTDEWNEQAKLIARRVEDAIQAMPTRTIAQQDKKENLGNQIKLKATVKGSTTNQTIDIVAIDTDVGKRYYSIDKFGKRLDVTEDVNQGEYVFVTTGNVSVTNPQASIPSQIERIRAAAKKQ